jgi:hypothetical protein
MGITEADATDLAWNANVQAVQDAKAAFIDARRRQADTECAVGVAARRRSPTHPVLTDDEIEAVTRARDTVRNAWADYLETQQVFKAGVTPEQVADMLGAAHADGD